MGNVVMLRGRDLVKALEQQLEQARRGDIRVMAFAAVMSDGNTCEGWVGELDSDTVLLYGAINILRDGYFHRFIEHTSEADRGGSG